MTPTVSSSEKRASSPNNQTIHLETFGRSPLETFQSLLTVGGNGLAANFLAALVGAFMYFATLTEVPIVQGLLGAGMGQGPALAP